MAGPDRYRRLFGEVALEKGVINSEQLLQALSVQERLREDGKPVPLLGQILVELGYLTPEELQGLIEFIYPVGDDVISDEKMAGSEEV